MKYFRYPHKKWKRLNFFGLSPLGLTYSNDQGTFAYDGNHVIHYGPNDPRHIKIINNSFFKVNHGNL